MKVTIITPIYNVEQYIERCAISLFEQDFDDIEYIFVNDCTPDNSIQILEQIIEWYPQRKPHIKIIHHEENRGLGWARNTGMQHATGEYILHTDSDDWCELDMISSLYYKAKETDADIVGCDVLMRYTDRQEYHKQKFTDSWSDNFSRLLLARDIFPNVWNKLVKRDLYVQHNISPPKHISFTEDWYLMIRLFSVTDKIAYVPRAFYHYRQDNSGSITNAKKSDKFWNDFQWFCQNTDSFLRETYQPEKTEIGSVYVGLFKKIVREILLKETLSSNENFHDKLAVIYPDAVMINREKCCNIAVITSTIGRDSLHRCICSVINQSYPAKHYIYIDGPEYEERAKAILKHYANVEVIVMDKNTGANGWSNSFINARACQEIDADIICFLDDDNCYEYHHIETMVKAFAEEPDTDIAYTNRRYFGRDEKIICDDNADSLGIFARPRTIELPITYKGYHQRIQISIDKLSMQLVDTNCMAMSQSYARKYGNDWCVQQANDRYVWQQALARNARIFGTGKRTVNYLIDLPTIYGENFFPQLAQMLGLETVSEQDINELEKVFLITMNDTVPNIIGHTLWNSKVKVGY